MMFNKESLALDSQDMLTKVGSLPEQLESGIDDATPVWSGARWPEANLLVVAGMGGSAIGGEILKSYLARAGKTPIVVSRGYTLPGYVGPGAVVVVSSYSGNTAEALSCFEMALERKVRIACITSGGELKARARKMSIPLVELPPGYPPRAAVGHSFAALLALAWELGLCEADRPGLEDCSAELKRLRRIYSFPDSSENTAMFVAKSLVDLTPVLYCASELKAVVLRWKNQICENSKKMAYTGLLPEMSHNDIMGWEVPEESLRAGVVFLRSSGEHPMVSARFPLIRDIIKGRAAFCGEYWGSGASLLSRLFSLILLGDYASVYLALLRGLDPTPIATIDGMKSKLERT
jgi:glucose/mannose-6-phosphate isomerase